MPFLDLRTLYAVDATVFAGLAVFLIFAWRQTPGMSGLGSFALAPGLMVLGAGLTSLAGGLPDLLSIVLANTLFVLAAAIVAEGTRLFYGLRPERKVTAGAALLAAVVSGEALYVVASVRARVAVVTGLQALLLIGAAWTACARGRARDGRSALLLGLSLGALGGVVGVRAGVVALDLRIQGDWPAATSLLCALLAGMGTTLGLMSAVNQRLLAAREEAQRRLAEREEHYRSVVDGSPDLIYRADALGYFTYANPSAARVMGYSQTELAGKRFLELIRRDFRQAAAEFYAKQALEAVPTTYFEFPATAKDGREVWIGQNVQLVAEGGEVEGFEAVARDITERKRTEAELRHQQDLLQRLVELGRAAIARPELEGTLQNTLEAASQLTSAEGASLFLLQESGELRGAIVAHAGLSPSRSRQETGRILDEGLAGWVAQNREPALVPDVALDPRWLALEGAPQPIRSALSAPILDGQNLVGVLTLIHSRPGHFGAAHLEFISAASPTIAIAVRNAQLFEARAKLATRQGLLYETLSRVSRTFEPGETARAAADAIARETSWKWVGVFLPGSTGRWEAYYPGAAPRTDSLRIAEGIVGRAFRTGATQVVSDVRLDPDYVPESTDARSEISVPLCYGGETLGVLNIESEQADAFGAEDVRLAESLAEAVALALGHANLQERHRRMFEDLPIGAYRTLPDGRILAANRALLGMLGYSSFSELAERTLDGPGYEPQYDRGEFRRRLERDGEITGLESVWRTRDGSGIFVRENAKATRRPDGSLVYDGTVEDISDRKRVEELREDLTRTMVHDLRSPLTAILGALEVLEAAPSLAPSERQLVSVAKQSADRQLGLVNAILDIGRLESGAMPLNREDLRLSTLASDVLRLLAAAAEKREHALVNDVAPAVPAVWADQGLVRRVLQNLVDNAVKFTPRGGEIRVSARREDSEYVRVEVTDTGAGPPSQLRDRLFEKFATGGQEGRGSGLGLAFCKLAVEAHGGRMWVDSRPGLGGVFAFTLPVAPRRPPRAARQQTEPSF